MPFSWVILQYAKIVFRSNHFIILFQDFLCFIIFRLSNVCKYDVDRRFFAIKKQLRRPDYFKINKRIISLGFTD